MNIVLVIPPSPGKNNIIRMIDCSHEAKANYLWQPNDFMIITSLLGPFDDIVFIDGTADVLSEVQFLRQVRAASGDFLIFALSSVCWESDYSFFRKTKELLPNMPFYVLGDIFLEEDYQQMILKQCDGIVVNPYELNLSEMARSRTTNKQANLPGVITKPGQALFPDGKHTITTKSKTPRHDLFLKKRYRFPFARHFRFTTVTTVWGCPFVCAYCTDSHFPPVVRYYQDVLSELDYVAVLGITELFFADKVFGFSAQNVYPLLEAMASRYRFSWSCYFNPHLYDPKLLDMMQAAGCHTMIIGIDSADVPSLQRYRRNVDPQKIEKLILHAQRTGLSTCADFILGLPHETEADIVRTIGFALEKPIDFASFNIAAPLPGSDIRKRVKRAGLLHFGKEGFDTCARMGILGNDNISAEQVKMLRKKAFSKFYLRPSYWLRRLKKTTSIEHFIIQLFEMLSMLKKYH